MKRSVIWLITVLTIVCLLGFTPAYAGGDRDFDHGRGFDRDGWNHGWDWDNWWNWGHERWRYDLNHINQHFMITSHQAWDWHVYKSQQGPTYAGSTGWANYVKFLEDKMDAYGLIDKYYIDIPYNRYVVNDWPDRRTHYGNFAGAIEKLVSDGTVVPVVAGYGMTSGYTGANGVTAPMIYYDPAAPPADAAMTGKIVVFKTVPYTAAVPGSNPPYDYTNSFLDSYTFTDHEYQTPGYWYPMYTPPPPSVTSSYYYRWVWNQVGGFATIGQRANAAGMVVVYDFSPGGAFGVTQRTVYTKNVPTLTLDRVNGAKVITDAQAGKTATLTLIASFEESHGKAIIGFLPGKNYGTPQDEQIVIATHTDAMSLVEDNGGLGLLGILHYFNHIPQSERPRTLVFYFDCRHFMPGGESSWPQYDYFDVTQPGYPLLKSIVATVGLEHMAARQTIETGPGGNVYAFSRKGPNSGGLITSLIDVNNNNIWLIKKIKKAAEDNHWPRVDAKVGNLEPGVNGGYQGSVKSPMNKGKSLGIPGIGLAGDWPGAATQTYAQLDSEAGFPSIDKDYFVTQVAGMSQMVGEFMLVKPIVIDLGWGQLKSGLVCTLASICRTAPSTGLLPDSAFITPASAPVQRQALLDLYTAAFKKVEDGKYDKAKSKLEDLKAKITAWIVSPTALNAKIDAQIAKLPAED